MRRESNAPLVTEPLCQSFADAADALSFRRAGQIPEQAIDDFVALGWMGWHGGSLRITALGHMVLVRIRQRLAETVSTGSLDWPTLTVGSS